jgi:hypothetical protein
MAERETGRDSEDKSPDVHETSGGPGVGEQARALKDDLSTANLNESLEEAVSDRPLLGHLLDLRIVVRAVAIAVIVALLAWLLIGPGAAAIALVLLYFGSWYVLAQMSYSRRRPTRPADGDDREGADGDREGAGSDREDAGSF